MIIFRKHIQHSDVGNERLLESRMWPTKSFLFRMTLSDLVGHPSIANLFKCNFSYSCAATENVSTDTARHLTAEFLVHHTQCTCTHTHTRMGSKNSKVGLRLGRGSMSK